MDHILPLELLDKVFRYLDPVSALAFGSCSSRLQEISCQPLAFGNILEKVKFETKKRFSNEDEEMKMSNNRKLVRQFVEFIEKVPFDSESLTMDLVETIVNQFPGQTWEKIVVEDEFMSASVDSWGLMLLVQTGAILHLKSCRFTMVSGSNLSGNLMMDLASLVQRDLSKGIRELMLDVFMLDCNTAEERKSLSSLLGCCQSWNIDNLNLGQDLDEEIWTCLASAGDWGEVGAVNVFSDVVKRAKNRLDDLRTVWENTKIGWSLGEIKLLVSKANGTVQGWETIKTLFNDDSSIENDEDFSWKDQQITKRLRRDF